MDLSQVHWTCSSAAADAAPDRSSPINFTYDANGNVRERSATFRALDASGNVAGTDSSQDNWYKYDAMNRFVTTKGVFTGSAGSGSISRGADQNKSTLTPILPERRNVLEHRLRNGRKISKKRRLIPSKPTVATGC